ncbi:MAG TPA: TonB family protein [Chthoniobacterales bacterium]|nr:TonB family protein [Chthoniobacterales bacterium]
MFCAIGALIFALPGSAADQASAKSDKKRSAAQARYITGSGVILIRVERISGTVLQATMVKSTGNKMLDAAAENSFRNQTMKLNGASQIKLPITFRIRAD